MTTQTYFRRIVVAVLASGILLTTQVHAQNKPGGFRQWLQALTNASHGSIAGDWRGSKIENDPIHGGYISLNFAFTFSPDGTYQETAYMGGRQVMSAAGTYQQNGSNLTFNPQQCNFASPDLGQTVKFFPIPTDSAIDYSIGFSPIDGGSQISLQNPAVGDEWGLKPAR